MTSSLTSSCVLWKSLVVRSFDFPVSLQCDDHLLIKFRDPAAIFDWPWNRNHRVVWPSNGPSVSDKRLTVQYITGTHFFLSRTVFHPDYDQVELPVHVY